MPIEPGDRVPDVRLQRVEEDGARPVRTADLFADRTAVLFAVPGAFTPTCSDVHVPGFVVQSEALREQGVDLIACTAVNDAHVMTAWSQQVDPAGSLTMLADGNGDLARALGLELDGSPFGLGVRSRRYAMVIDDGTVAYLGVESGPEVGVSAAEAVLEALADGSSADR